MSSYSFTVIVPIIYLTEYSRKAIVELCRKSEEYKQVFFVLSCSESVEQELIDICSQRDLLTNVIIAKSNKDDSNSLRYNGLKYAMTDYIYYQDCDDEVNYQVILDNIKYCDGNNVVCFNITRRQFGVGSSIREERQLYPSQSFSVDRINKLMTNIVNKLIPLKHISKAHFYNIPFSQDLSLSFQLFEKCPHYYCSDSAYLYINNAKSTAGINKTKRSSLLRVVAFSRILQKILVDRNNRAYANYRYGIIIHDRFAFLGENYWPSFELRVLNPFYYGMEAALRHLYHYIKVYYSCLRITIRSKFIINKNLQK